MAKFLVFSGSIREGSVNTKLAQAAANLVPSPHTTTLISLQNYPLPIYNAAEEANNFPPHATKLKDLFAEHDGIIITSPEYNGSISPLLKNTLDWVSRVPAEGNSPFKNKTAAILSASPGGLGGLRGLAHLRDILSGIGMVVMPSQVAVGNALEEFSPSGELTTKEPMVKAAMAELATFTS